MQSPQKQPSYIRASTTSILCLTWQTLTGSCSLGTICLNYGQSMTLLLPKLGHRSLTYFNTVSLSLIRDLYLGQCPFVFPQVIHMDVVGPAGIYGHRSLTYFFYCVCLCLICNLCFGQSPFVSPKVIHMDVMEPARGFRHRSLTYFDSVYPCLICDSYHGQSPFVFPRSYTWLSWNQSKFLDIDHRLILLLCLSLLGL